MEDYRIYPQNEYEDVKNHHAGYGIVLYRDGRPVRMIGDISCDRVAVERLARLFSEEDLDPVHFDQAVEDFLTDFSV